MTGQVPAQQNINISLTQIVLKVQPLSHRQMLVGFHQDVNNIL